MNLLLSKLGRRIWLDTGLTHVFFQVMDLNSILVNKPAKKEIFKYPAILTSYLVNNLHLPAEFVSDATWKT